MGEVWLQFLGSLAAIVALAWIAARLRLGGDARIANEEDARRIIDEAISGFDAVEIAIGDDGKAAIACDSVGRVMVLRRHGSHFVGRVLTSKAIARADNAELLVDSGERRFGAVSLALDRPLEWVSLINTGDKAGHA